MAETKTLRTRIKLLYKNYAEWESIKNTFVPLMGEVCFCEVPATTGVVVNEPCVLFKVGDGEKTFAELPWTSSTAADVAQWAKKNSLEFADLDNNFKAALEEFIEQHSTATDTQYRIVADGDNKWKLQKSVDGEVWVDATGVIDVSGLDSKIDEEVARAIGAEAKKVDKEITSTDGKALIFNEKSGGGAKFENVNGIESFVGVNDGSNGLYAQIYADKMIDGKWSGVKIDIGENGAYYTVGNKSAAERMVEDNEIATKKDIASIAVPEYTIVKETDPGDYAAIYHLTKDGEAVGEAINIAKDQLLKSVEIKTCVEKDMPVTGLEVGDKYMDFTFIVEKGEEAHTYIAIKDMVKPYTAGEGIVITSENAITFDEEVIASVEYVDASINDTMNFIIQERDAEKAARENGDNLLAAEIAKKTTEHISGPNGDSYSWNESSGGGNRFVHNDGSEAFVGVNDGGKDGLMVQIYADVQKDGKWSGSRISAYNDKIYYVNKEDRDAGVENNDADHEIATVGDISSASEGIIEQANAYTDEKVAVVDEKVDALDEKVDALDESLADIAKTGNVNDLIQEEADILILDCNF